MPSIVRSVDSQSLDRFTFENSSESLEFISVSFTDWLAEYIEGGATVSDGKTLQYGYAMLLCRVEGRTLQLFAPDFQSMPIKWQADLGTVFEIVAFHKYTPETFEFEPDIPSLRQSVTVGRRFDEVPMFANRMERSHENDSGWFIGSTLDEVDNNDPTQLTVVSLYEAMLQVPYVTQFLSLPVGCQVVFETNRPVILKDYEELKIPKGSYLDLAMESR